jgi:hypothetical protein
MIDRNSYGPNKMFTRNNLIHLQYIQFHLILLYSKKLHLRSACWNVYMILLQVLHFSGYKFTGINPFNPNTYFKILGKISFLTGFWSLFVFYKVNINLIKKFVLVLIFVSGRSTCPIEWFLRI